MGIAAPTLNAERLLLRMIVLVALLFGRSGDVTANAADEVPSSGTLEPIEFAGSGMTPADAAPEGAATADAWEFAVFSPDSRLLATRGLSPAGGQDIWVWNVADAKVVARAHLPESAGVLAFSPGGELLAVGPDGPRAGVVLLKSQTGQTHTTLPGPAARTNCLAWSEDGKQLALGSTLDKTVRVWDVSRSSFVKAYELGLSNVLAVGYTKQGTLLAVGSPARERLILRVLDVVAKTPVQTLAGHKEMIESSSLFQHGTQIVSGGWDASLRLWKTAQPDVLGELAGHKKGIVSLAISADGKRIASSSTRELKLWDGESKQLLGDLGTENDGARFVALSPDGTALISIHRDGTTRLWDVEKRTERVTLERKAEGTVAADSTVSPSADSSTPPPGDAPEPEAIQALAYSRDGRWLAIAREDGRVSLRNAADGKVLRELEAFTDVAASVVFSPDSRRVASGSFDKVIKVWEVESGELVAEMTGHKNWIFGVAFSPDGETLASASYDKSVRLWNVSDGKELAQLSGHTAGVRAVAFSQDGKRLVSAGSDRTAIVWDLETRQPEATLKGHQQSIRDVAYSPDGGSLATASEDGTVRLWRTADWTERAVARGADGVMFWCLAYSPQGRTLAAGAFDGSVKLFDPADGKERSTLTGPTDAVTGVAFAPDAHEIVVSSTDKSFRRYRARGQTQETGATAAPVALKAGEAAVALKAVTLSIDAPVLTMVFDDGGKTVFVGTGGYRSAGAVQAWNLESREQLWTTPSFRFGVPGLGLSANGKQLAAGNFADNFVRLYETKSGERTRELRGHRSKVHAIAYAPDGRTFATASLDRDIKVWDTSSSREIRTLVGHKDYVLSITYSADSRTLLSASADQTVRTWTVESGKEVRQFTGHDALVQQAVLSRDGKRVATASADGSGRVYDAPSGDYLFTLRGHRGKVESVAISPDGRLIATGSSDRTVRVWDASCGAELMKLTQESVVRAVRFSPDGKSLAAGGDGKTVTVWDLSGFRLASETP